jgi:hypothetical protein
MVGPFPGIPYSLRRVAADLWAAIRALRRMPALCSTVPGRDPKTFSCCRCGTDGALAITEPNTETGMTDYQLDQVEGPQHHPAAIDRLTGRGLSAPVDYSGGELPGRKVDGRR